ncbi:hypothetical protein BASA81_016358 [Batrachochytrium salamandrivorans]|nr:hypothetical protein BASA81_016358 [Batrachochytrium salamandrivorans]
MTDTVDPVESVVQTTDAVAETAQSTTHAPFKDDMTLTVRLIKSFDYRTFKNLVVQHIAKDMLVKDFKILVLEKIKSTSGLKPYHTVVFDCLKLYVKAHGSKSQHLIINLDHDSGDDTYILDDAQTLASHGIEHETEVSFFNTSLYLAYKANPETKW